MRLIYPIILLLLKASPVWTQTHEQRDSLLQIAQNATNDTARVWALMETGKLYLNTDADSAVLYIDQALGLAESIGFRRGIARCRINNAVAIYNLGQLDSVLALCNAAIPICEEENMGKELVAIYNMMGNTWKLKGNTWLAIRHFDKCLEAMKTAEVPPHFPVVVNNNIAIIYNDLGLYDKAISYASKGLYLAEEMGDEETAALAAQHLGLAYKRLHNNEKALKYFQQAADAGRKHGLTKLLATVLSNLADMSADNRDFISAHQLYTEGLQVARDNGDKEGMIYNLHGKSMLAFSEKKYATAEKAVMEALQLTEEIQLSSYSSALYLTLSDLSLAKGDIDSYTIYRDKYFAGRDSLSSGALVHALQELETRYETEQKEQRILALEQEQEIQQLRIRQKNNLIGWLIAAAIAMVLLAVLVWIVFRNRRKILSQEILIQGQQIKELEQESQLGFAGAVMQGQENERSRLARDLHDGLGGMLSGIRQALFASSPSQAIVQAISDLDLSISELRNIARNMMPEALVRFGLKDALEDYCSHLRQSGGLQIHFQAYGMDRRLPPETEVVLFRIAQELLNNTVRHAGATTALVQLLRDDKRLSLTVEDDGIGFDPIKIDTEKGIGWTNIRSRASYIGGILDLRTAPGEGCSVHLQIETE